MSNGVLSVIALILLVGMIWVQYRTNKRNLEDIRSGRRSLDEGEVWLKNAAEAEALVVSQQVELNPKVEKIAKVDLELEIQQPGSGPVVRKTTWLVEVPSLPELKAGNKVKIKFDPKKPQRIFPTVPWARAWLFGKPRKQT